ncbi:tryptophanyl-trna synthetase like protein [Teratosphaeria destructans]|uniref:Tryptophan--tRNA ligase, mitochondrial n=1 Tax=Teratosphaeria destructans TaxID=418781 RepID=A0A9W7SYY1_9PEZI|nr:tryptophanyl-trna synthetase like protein [Teratosphaeria destructans]
MRSISRTLGLEQALLDRLVSSKIDKLSGNGFKSQVRAVSSSPPDPSPKRIFSGIQPTGVPHLGNYLGALRQWVKLQNDPPSGTETIYSLVDLHAITIRQDPSQLRQWKKESLAMLLAIGLDPAKSIIFHQSDVSAHTELMWMLSCQASTGYLGRMTQWKDKTEGEKEGGEKLKLGLFSYPVLQAADILVHGATHVPVGHDQAQHLEFSRQIANGFNESIGNGKQVLVPPETLISPAKRVMSLTEPEKKMSKSHPNPKSRILLTDTEDVIRKKINGAITDSVEGITFDPERRPGVSNLLEVLYHAQDDAAVGSPAELAKHLNGLSMRLLKRNVADAVCGVVEPIRERYQSIVRDQRQLDAVAEEGASKAAQSASMVMKKVRKAIGFD